MIVGKQAGCLAVADHPRGPVLLVSPIGALPLGPDQRGLFAAQGEEFLGVLLVEWVARLLGRLQLLLQLAASFLHVGQCLAGRLRGQGLAQIGCDPAAVAAGVESGQHTFSIGTNPDPHVERSSFRRVLKRLPASSGCRGTPCEFLRRETLHAGVRQDGRQGSRESEAVRQHVFGAGLAKLFAKPVIPIQNLTNDGFRAGRVHIALFHGGAGWKPPPFLRVLLHLGKIGRVVLLHQAVAVGAAEIENIVRILFEQFEVVLHRLAEVFVDHLGILPAPFRVQVRVSHHIEDRPLAQVGLFRGLCLGCPGHSQEGHGNRHQSRADLSHRNSPKP